MAPQEALQLERQMHQPELYRWHKLASVQIGGAICLPVILIGYELARRFGFGASLVAILIGNSLLCGLAIISSEMSWKHKKTTPENAGIFFGAVGKQIIALLLTISMCGWFAIQTQIVSQDISIAFSLPQGGFSLVLSVLFASCLFFGLKGITRLSDLSIPIMCLTLLVVLVWAFCYGRPTSAYNWKEPFQLPAISMVMAVAIGVCIDMPTFFCQAASRKHSFLGAVATFLVGIPVVEGSGVLIYEWSKLDSLMQALRGPQLPLWSEWVGLFLLIAAWTTNTTNLYSAAMGIKALAPRWSLRQVFCASSLVVIVLSQIDLISHLAFLLEVLGVLLASSFGVILVAFVIKQPIKEWVKISAFAAGVGTLFLSQPLPTGIAVLDGALISALTTFIGSKTT